MSNRIEFNCYDCPEDNMEIEDKGTGFSFYSLDCNTGDTVSEATVVLSNEDAVKLALFIIKRSNIDKKLFNSLFGKV